MPFNIGPFELIVVLIIALVVLGPGKLPEVGSALGKSIREFRRAASDVEDAARLDRPAAPPAPPAQLAPPADEAAPSTPAQLAPSADEAAPSVPAPSAPAPAPNTLARQATPNEISSEPRR